MSAGTAAMLGAAAANVLQGLGAQKIKEIANDLGGEGSPAHVALHAVLGCAAGAQTVGGCGAGAVGASASVVFNTLLNKLTKTDTEKLTEPEKQARLTLLDTLLAGVASALSPSAMSELMTAARTEGENNQFAPPMPIQGGAAFAGAAIGNPRASGLNNAGYDALARAQGQYAQPTLADQFGKLFDSIVAGLGDFLFPQPAEPSDGYTPLGGMPMSEPWWVSPPGQSSDTIIPIAIPGLANDGPQEGLTTITPAVSQAGYTLIYKNVDPAPGETTVYISLDGQGKYKYVGITDDVDARSQAHQSQKGIGIQAIPGLTDISRDDARAVEQVLIEYYGLGKNGGSLLNKINSIAVYNPKYANALVRGAGILKSVNYEGFE